MFKIEYFLRRWVGYWPTGPSVTLDNTPAEPCQYYGALTSAEGVGPLLRRLPEHVSVLLFDGTGTVSGLTRAFTWVASDVGPARLVAARGGIDLLVFLWEAGAPGHVNPDMLELCREFSEIPRTTWWIAVGQGAWHDDLLFELRTAAHRRMLRQTGRRDTVPSNGPQSRG